MGDLSIKGHESAYGGQGTQRVVSTELSASQSKEITKTLGINFSKGNDSTVEVPYKKNDGSDSKLFVTPDDLGTLQKIGQGTTKAENTLGSSDPVQVYQKGTLIGTIDPKQIPNK